MKSFCISLEKKKDTWPALERYFLQNGVENISFFSAVNGNEIGEYFRNLNTDKISSSTQSLVSSLGGIDKIVSTWGLYNLINKKNRKDHAQLSSWGAVGCSLSHILLWKNMIDQNLDSILIFEDDVNLFDNFKDDLPAILENIPEDADIIFLDISRNFKPVRYNDLFDKVLDQFFGTHAYIITKKGAKALLPYVFPIEIQIDSFIGFRANLNNLSLYAARNMCGQKTHVSTIQTLEPCTLCDFTEKQIHYLNYTMNFILLIAVFLVFIAFYFLVKKIIKI